MVENFCIGFETGSISCLIGGMDLIEMAAGGYLTLVEMSEEEGVSEAGLGSMSVRMSG